MGYNYYIKACGLMSVAFVTLTPVPSLAWNLICGVSIGLQVASVDTEKKWDADSYAIKGMGMYYLAISDLQRIQINADSVVNPNTLSGEGSSIDEAIKYLGESQSNFTEALDMAKSLGLGDDKGLGYLTQLIERTQSLKAQLEANSLPNLDEIHETTSLVVSYTQYGMELSMKHLEMGVSGHGKGGVKF